MKALFKGTMEEVSYPELSSWATAAIITTMLFYYVSKLATLDAAGMLNTETHNRLLFLIVIVTIVTEIIFQIIVAVFKRLESNRLQDERDKSFSQKATQVSSNFIFGFLAILILIVSQSDFLIEQLSLNLRGLSPKDVLLSILVIGFGMSQLLHHFSLAMYYRRGS